MENQPLIGNVAPILDMDCIRNLSMRAAFACKVAELQEQTGCNDIGELILVAISTLDVALKFRTESNEVVFGDVSNQFKVSLGRRGGSGYGGAKE